MNHAEAFLTETAEIAGELSRTDLAALAAEILRLRNAGGRLFLAGLGGSAANASHAANDFRKLAGIDAICLSDNVAELTARANDEGWDSMYADTLKAARPRAGDALMVLSVGGGAEKVSQPLVKAVDYALTQGMRVLGIVGRDGGYTKRNGHAVVLVPTVAPARVTAHTEAFQSVVLHYLVSHPEIQIERTKW